MMDITTQLYQPMNDQLRQLAAEQESLLQQAGLAYQIVESYLKQLRDSILCYTFRSVEEEIQFFKEDKPMFLREYIYFKEVFYIESGCLAGNADFRKNYLSQNLERVQVFFQRNHYLYAYYRTGESWLDHTFFVRNAQPIPLLPIYTLDIDSRFSTVYSFILSKLQAFEQLQHYLQSSIDKLNREPHLLLDDRYAHPVTWTASKAGLIELAYALHSSGVFNFGKMNVSQVITVLEDSFNIQLGNYYRVFQGQRIRKKTRTIFLDKLKENLIRRMDDTDLHPGNIK